MLVDEVEPKKVRIALRGQHVPGKGDRQEESDSADPGNPQQKPPALGKQEIEENHRPGNDETDQPFGERRQGGGREHAVPEEPLPSFSPVLRLRQPEAGQGGAEEKGQRHVDDGGPGESNP